MAEADRSQAPSPEPTKLDDIANRVNEVHYQIVASLRMSLRTATEAGGFLREAKQTLGRGGFLKWVEQSCDFGERTAQRYMRASRWAEENPTSVTDSEEETLVGLLHRIAKRSGGGGADSKRRKELRKILQDCVRQARDLVVRSGTARELSRRGLMDDSQLRQVDEIDWALGDKHAKLSALAASKSVDDSTVEQATELLNSAAGSFGQILAIADEAWKRRSVNAVRAGLVVMPTRPQNGDDQGAVVGGEVPDIRSTPRGTEGPSPPTAETPAPAIPFTDLQGMSASGAAIDGSVDQRGEPDPMEGESSPFDLQYLMVDWMIPTIDLPSVGEIQGFVAAARALPGFPALMYLLLTARLLRDALASVPIEFPTSEILADPEPRRSWTETEQLLGEFSAYLEQWSFWNPWEEGTSLSPETVPS